MTLGKRGNGALEEPDRFVGLRQRMVAEQLRERGVRDARVLEAMGRVPRQRFVARGRR